MLRFFRSQNALRLLFTIALILGIFFRFAHLDRKVYWHDEVYTSLRINGYNGGQVVRQAFTGKRLTVEELLAFQRPSPEKDFGDVLAVLKEHPEHPPLYFIMVHFWVRWWGSSITAIRSLSAILSLFTFPALYWFCWELFGNAVVGQYAIALVAVSPFYVLYAQEARQYSLWTVAILLACAALLRGIRLTQQQSQTQSLVLIWGLYTLTLALSFYTFLFSVLVAISHAIYILIIEKFRLTKTVLSFATATSLSLLLFSPWIWVILTNYSQIEDKTYWTTNAAPLNFLIKLWGLHLSCIFADYGFLLESAFTYTVPPLILIFVCYILYFFYRHVPKRVWLLLFLLIAVNVLALALPDLILGGVRSSNSRYFIPCYISIQLAVAYFLMIKLSSSSRIEYRIGVSAIAFLLTSGIVSCTLSFQAETWWNKAASYSNSEIAALINQASTPLVVSDNNDINVGNIISLSHLLNSQTSLLLVTRSQTLNLAKRDGKTFLYNPSSSLREAVESKYNREAKQVYQGYLTLWEL